MTESTHGSDPNCTNSRKPIHLESGANRDINRRKVEQKASSRTLTSIEKSTHKDHYVKREANCLVKDLKRLIQEELKRQRDAPIAVYEEISTEIQTSFTSHIANVDPPFRFVVPILEVFNGSMDLKEHVLQYHNSVVPLGMPQDKKEAMMCKMFASSLKGPLLT